MVIMEPLIKTYHVKVVRQPGPNPMTGQMVGRAEEDLLIDATSPQSAHQMAYVLHTIPFRGQEMSVYIDGELHLNESR